MELVLVRHAEPVRVDASMTNGAPADPTLTPRGNEQAERLASWLAHERFDAIVVSPKLRAIETAAPIAQRVGMTPVVNDGLAEYDRNAEEYIPIEELRATKDPRFQAMIDGRWQEHGGDDPDDFRRRIETALNDIVDSYSGQRVLAVCHGGVINYALALVMQLDRHLWFTPDYTSISRIVAARSGVRTVVSVNETAHLYATRQ